MAIAANELRIGNLILVNGKIEEVDGVHERGINPYVGMGDADCDYYFESDKIEPIPITPEILGGCGFILYTDENKMVKYFGGDKKFIFKNGILSINVLGSNYIWDFEHIQCLYQFQNLYFELTGTELEVNLTQ